MEKSLFVNFLGDTPLVRVMDFFIGNSIFDYTKTDIAENSDVSRASLYTVWPQLEQYGIVKASRKIGNTTLYRLNKENPVVQKLIELDLKLSREYADTGEKVAAKVANR
ncbi:hypothetical protein H0O01_03060 [Candidatus Micrarchaeota archaeon]|nr:hypothetical protein [Candidatus Micrarchaeota archaeon]